MSGQTTHFRSLLHALRLLLLLLCWLPALLPRASASAMAPSTADFPRLASEFSGGCAPSVADEARRVLVRQNPWSAFDPEGLDTDVLFRKGWNPLKDVESAVSKAKEYLFPAKVPGTPTSNTEKVAKEVVNQALSPVETAIEGPNAAERIMNKTGTPGGLTALVYEDEYPLREGR